MEPWIWIVAGLIAWMGLTAWLLRLERAAARKRDRKPLKRQEPGWVEELPGDGKLRTGRSFSFDDDLMEQDARGRRGEFDTGAG